MKRLSAPWMTDALLRCVREKHRLYRLSVVDSNFSNVYKRYRNTLCGVIKRAKEHFYAGKFRAAAGNKYKINVVNNKCNTKTQEKDG